MVIIIKSRGKTEAAEIRKDYLFLKIRVAYLAKLDETSYKGDALINRRCISTEGVAEKTQCECSKQDSSSDHTNKLGERESLEALGEGYRIECHSVLIYLYYLE
jgi:hypothetical protein